VQSLPGKAGPALLHQALGHPCLSLCFLLWRKSKKSGRYSARPGSEVWAFRISNAPGILPIRVSESPRFGWQLSHTFNPWMSPTLNQLGSSRSSSLRFIPPPLNPESTRQAIPALRTRDFAHSLDFYSRGSSRSFDCIRT
jgi:hypothetical protein